MQAAASAHACQPSCRDNTSDNIHPVQGLQSVLHCRQNDGVPWPSETVINWTVGAENRAKVSPFHGPEMPANQPLSQIRLAIISRASTTDGVPFA